MRQLIGAAMMALLVMGGGHQGAAQPYPNKPVKMLVPSGAGGPPDLLARVIADALGASLGQRFIIDNKPAAGGVVAGEAVVNSPADGYTLLYANSSTQSINPALYTNMPYDPAVALTP